MGVAGGRPHLKHPIAYVKNRHVKGAAPQVKHQNGLVLGLIQTVGQGRRRRLVENTLDLEPGNAPGVAGGLALGIVEVGGHGNHRSGDRLAQVAACLIGQLAQHNGRNFFGGKVFFEPGAAHFDVARVVAANGVGHPLRGGVEFGVATPHIALHPIKGVLGVEHRLSPGHLAHQTLALFAKGHHRGGRAHPLGIGNYHGLATLHDRDH